MKYLVHTYQVDRVVYEVTANSPEEAYFNAITLFDTCANEFDREKGEEILPAMLVDPILPNGEVDYDNCVNFEKAPEELA